MHYYLEIIMPPTEDVEAAVKQIMTPFDENNNESWVPFWDFYVIGGRYSGIKIQSMIDQDRLKQFYAELNSRNITVSGFQCGKQELSPLSQIPIVDVLWQEWFPESKLKLCPLFNHFNDQYKNILGFPDVMEFKDIPPNLEAFRVIFAGPKFSTKGLEPVEMYQQSFWNGISHIDCKWQGSVAEAVSDLKDKTKDYNPEYVKKIIPQDDWLCVTVDYHS